VPLHTLRANIDYGFYEARTTFGRIGVKVWLYKGEVPVGSRAEREAALAAEALRQRRDRPASSRPRRSGSQGTTGVSTDVGRSSAEAVEVTEPVAEAVETVETEVQESPITSEAEAAAEIASDAPTEVNVPEPTEATDETTAEPVAEKTAEPVAEPTAESTES
jgi:small subunit ribosomal protein S3